MKILYIVSARMPTEKAYGLQIAKTAEAFCLAGQSVEMLLPLINNTIKQDIFDYYGLRKRFKLTYFKNFFFFLDKISIPLYFRVIRFFFTPYAIWHGLRSRADIIFSRNINICFSLSLFGKSVVLEEHEPKLSKPGLYKYFLKKIPKKVVVAANLADLYEKFGITQKSFIIAPNGVDREEFDKVAFKKNIWQKEFNISSNNKVILYVGHFYKWKGVYTLIDSAKHLANTTVVLIGGADDEDKIVKTYIQKHKISNVTLGPYIQHQKVIQYIKSADVLVLPNTATETRSAKYTTPIKLFEYMASHVAIVASSLKSFSEYLVNGKNAILFEPDNPKDLAEKIKYILKNPHIGEQMSKNAYHDVKEFSWEKRVQKILDFIKT